MRDLNDVLDLTLRLPIRGKEYQVQPPPAAIGAHLLNRLSLGLYANAGLPMDAVEEEARGLLVVDDEEMPDFARMCLGGTYDEMVADGLDALSLDFAVTTAFYAWTVGKPFAEHYWETGGKVTGSTEEREERPTATLTPEAAASTTPSPASASGTKARKMPQDRRRKGSRSSSSGAATATPSSRTSTPSTASTSTSPNP